MRLTYRITKKEFLEAHWAHRRRRRGAWIVLVSIAIFILLALAMVIAGAILNRDAGALRDQWVFLLFSALWFSYLFILPAIYFRRIYIKDPRFAREWITEIADDGIRVDTGVTQIRTNWSAYYDFRETKNLILLYFAPTAFMVVPKRALPPAELEAFRRLLAGNIQKK